MTEPFYRTSADGGLRFDCTRCQRCCRLEPGYVFLSERDLQALARAKALSVAEFTARYCRTVDIGGFKRLSLTEKANFDCSLWQDGACTVYESRPLQCRSFPFWDANLASPDAWSEAAASCPGIDQGPVRHAVEIDYWLSRRHEEPLVRPEVTAPPAP